MFRVGQEVQNHNILLYNSFGVFQNYVSVWDYYWFSSVSLPSFVGIIIKVCLFLCTIQYFTRYFSLQFDLYT